MLTKVEYIIKVEEVKNIDKNDIIYIYIHINIAMTAIKCGSDIHKYIKKIYSQKFGCKGELGQNGYRTL